MQGQFIEVGGLQGQVEPEGGAHPGFAGHLNPGAVFVENAPHNGQAQSSTSLGVDGIFDPEKAFEDPLLVGGGDAVAGIGNLNAKPGQGGSEQAARPLQASLGVGQRTEVRPGVGPQRQLTAAGGELEGIAHQIVEHLQQQIPVAKHPRQVVVALAGQFHPPLPGIEAVGAQGLFDGRAEFDRFQRTGPFRFQPGEVEHIIDQAGEAIGFGVGNAQEFSLLFFGKAVGAVVQGFDVALDIGQGGAQLVGDVADETALGCVQLHLAGQVLDGHGDALEAFAAGIPHRLQHNPQGAGRFAKAAAHISAVLLALHERQQGPMKFHGQHIRQGVGQFVALQGAALPAEQAPGCGIGQDDLTLRIQQHRPIRHGGDQGLLLAFGGGQLLDIGRFVILQLGRHRVEALQQLPQFATHGQIDAGVEVAAGD